MADQLKAQVRVNLTESMDPWAAAKVAVSRMKEALSELSGKVIDNGVMLSAKDESSLERKSLEMMQDAVRELELEPRLAVCYIKLIHDPKRPFNSEAGADVWIWFYRGSSKLSRVDIDVFASKKMVRDGLRGAAERARAAIEAGVLAEVPVVRDLEQSTEMPQHQAVVESAAPKQPNWLNRSWRDHTATFVVTVVGGFVVAALVAWFGLAS